MSNLQEGMAAPGFTVATDGGGMLSLEDLKGRPAVIYFYPKDDTPGCTKEAISFSSLKGEFDRLNVAVIGISPDSTTRHDKFKTKHDLSVTLGADTDNQVATAYGVWGEKSMYGRKYMGIERSTFLIDSQGRLARIWRKVKVPGHAEEVLEAARALG
ncbi:thioredoxin-dependent thiol peroxidase [Stappia sp. F7233]|uniref:thioredoxin-dependent peroxiredoxin n=1 Tax=Stappia albiluteola TaxID=2758565 RepID=A0A839AC11_9HYPH|nr:thioredoxin-dependent thiol peroxidase [Stappia albiluteola]MBA5776482.1 thioredoxin-dependent thiol peroxidase [Stappia albiluteola]